MREARLVHRYCERSNHLYSIEHFYHANMFCMGAMKLEHIQTLCEKKWREKEMRKLVLDLQGQLK